jgi:hypothetical protein
VLAVGMFTTGIGPGGVDISSGWRRRYSLSCMVR